ncbi:MAG: DUF1707 SHOCT-like domain-containing protein [Streptosporangiaceae bacterium]
MKASDADRDAVLADLSEHFQAGRLTAGELDDRTEPGGKDEVLLAGAPAEDRQPAAAPQRLPQVGVARLKGPSELRV